MKTIHKKEHVTCYCDFCGKANDEVFKMVEGVGAFICSDCIQAAQMIITKAKETAGCIAVIGRLPKE